MAIPMKVVGVRLPLPVAQQLRRLAREDDRSVSAYLRRQLAQLVADSQQSREQAVADVGR